MKNLVAWIAQVNTLASARYRLFLITLVILSAFPALHTYAETTKSSDFAWQQMEKVLTHPRCLNCHSAGESPRQADDRHVHQFRVLNGHQGIGNPGALCIGCHQGNNQTASGVPGAANWQHAPASMTWESSPGIAMAGKQLCHTLRDPAKNGGRDLPALVQHLRSEPLVIWAWSPGSNAKGEARSTPPISHEEFVNFATLWANTGGKCPR